MFGRLGLNILSKYIPPAQNVPVPQFINMDFESPLNQDGTIPGWTKILNRIEFASGSGSYTPLYGGISTILGVPTPTDPTPNAIYSPDSVGHPNINGMSPGQGTGPAVYSISLANIGATGTNQSLYLDNGRFYLTGTNSSGGVLYGPAIYSNNPVICAIGDIIDLSYKVDGSGDYANVYGYLLDPTRSGDARYIQILDYTGNNTSWQQASITIQTNQVGNWYFVFICGTYDYTFGTYVGSSLWIDEVKITKA